MRTPDSELVSACLQGDEEAWKAFHETHGPAIRSAIEVTLRRATGQAPAGEIDDVCQLVFISLFADDGRRLRLFRARSSLQTWIRVIAARLALNSLRSRRECGSLDPELVADARSTESAGVLDPLPGRDRTLLYMAIVQEFSHKQIAEALHLSPNSISVLLNRAIDRARQELSGFGPVEVSK